MSVIGGPNIVEDGLVLSLDAANVKATLRKKQSSNILVDPHTWTLGTGGTTGYSTNGDATEQNRLYVDDDPWGRRSITWRTTPDAVSGADGGWNTSYYSIDRSFTYRWSVWVRRYTAGTGGTFYLGLNPAPIRNDNGLVRNNPYFTYPAISSLTQNQWYLVVAHCFYEGYSGGRHPDSGWYTNGEKISDLSYGNVGASDVRWNSATTSALHRAYHFYTTNTASGIEFAFPRLDKCDGTEPSISELINVGESGWIDLSPNRFVANLYNGVTYNGSNLGSFVFDGSTGYSDIPLTSYTPYCVDIWFNNHDDITSAAMQGNYQQLLGLGTYPGGVTLGAWSGIADNETIGFWGANYTVTGMTYIRDTVLAGIHNLVINWNGTSYDIWVDGQKKTTYASTSGHCTLHSRTTTVLGKEGTGSTSYEFDGEIYKLNIYTSQLSDTQVLQNYNATKGRFGL